MEKRKVIMTRIIVYLLGYGTEYYKDGACYSGSWSKNTKHGEGKLTSADGSWYNGSWVGGKKHGNGSSKTKN